MSKYAFDFSGVAPRVKQSAAAECDVHTIIARFRRGQPLPSSARPPQYGDFCGPDDYATALDSVIKVNDAFARLPPAERERHDNDPQQWLSSLADAQADAQSPRGDRAPKPDEVPATDAPASDSKPIASGSAT